MGNTHPHNGLIIKFKLLPLSQTFDFKNNKIIKVPYFNPELIKKSMENDHEIMYDLIKVKSINDIIKSIESNIRTNNSIYREHTDYICDESCGVCIENLGAESFRKIYSPDNYKSKYISFVEGKEYIYKISNKKNKLSNIDENIDNKKFDEMKLKYKIINVNVLSFNSKSIVQCNPTLNQDEIDLINSIINSCSNYTNKNCIDLFCDEQNKICIYNKDAYKFRQIYEGEKYDNNVKKIMWTKK